MKETWLPVVEFPEHYEVSNLGSLRRSAPAVSSYSGRPLRAHPTGRGYLGVTFTVNAIRYHRRVARVVAEAFLGAIPLGMVVNHKNGSVTDNCVENLEIVTQSENVRHAFDVLGVKRARGERQHLSKLTEPLVLEIMQLAADGQSHNDISRLFGVSKQAITAILTGKSWRHVTDISPKSHRQPNKLSKSQAQRVLVMRRNGWTQQAVADHFGVSKGAINDLCAGRTWKNLRR